ncbi:hypothetical protein [Amycolatopsis sp. NPDC059021]|uniref:hypothetical protein n=1 Tax=Amycolatopsis sp. NPDC059021 TaxID=3346704 RepID=UPI00366AF1C2
MFTITTVEMGHWTAAISGGVVTFLYESGDAGPNAEFRLPRVWPGRSLAIPAAELEAFHALLAEVMRKPAYRNACPPAADSTEPWSALWFDPDEEFVYLAGPCENKDGTAGYRPVRGFTIALSHVKGLRARVTGYLHPGQSGLEPAGRGERLGSTLRRTSPRMRGEGSVPGASRVSLSRAPARGWWSIR